MRPAPLIAPAVENVLQALHPRTRSGEASFPPGLKTGGARFSSSHPSVGIWFREVVDAHVPDCQVRKWSLEDNIFVFAHVRWKDGMDLEYANLQAVVVDGGDTEDLYLRAGEDEPVAQYLRVDFDLARLGPVLKEPQPHCHAQPRGEPRFSLPTDGNLIVAFLDFLYRNYRHDIWLDWAREVWARHTPPSDEDPLESIVTAFQTGKAELLRSHFARPLRRWKRLLREESARYPLRVHRDWLELLLYAP